MEKIVVNDTNVFIDLHDVGLLEQFFLLPWEVHTTDFVMLELVKEGQKDTVAAYESNGCLHIATFECQEVVKINKLHKAIINKSNLSLTDCSVWYYAKQNNYTLLTGDRKLRNSALNEGVEVRGIIYVFDELVANGIIPASLAAEKLTLLKSINPRLPENDIDKRLKLWTSEKKVEDVAYEIEQFLWAKRIPILFWR